MPTLNSFMLTPTHRKRKNFIARLVDDNRVLTKHEDKAALVDGF
jgi:hypothetical protein